MHELIVVMSVGKWVFCEIINIYDFSDGCISYFFYTYVHSSPYLFVCGDDRVICYPGVDDVSGELGDA